MLSIGSQTEQIKPVTVERNVFKNQDRSRLLRNSRVFRSAKLMSIQQYQFFSNLLVRQIYKFSNRALVWKLRPAVMEKSAWILRDMNNLSNFHSCPTIRNLVKGTKIDFIAEQISKVLKFLIEAYVEESKSVNTEMNAFQYRDESKLKRHFRLLRQSEWQFTQQEQPISNWINHQKHNPFE